MQLKINLDTAISIIQLNQRIYTGINVLNITPKIGDNCLFNIVKNSVKIGTITAEISHLPSNLPPHNFLIFQFKVLKFEIQKNNQNINLNF